MFYIEAHNPLVINILNLNQNLNTSLEITMRNLLIYVSEKEKNYLDKLYACFKRNASLLIMIILKDN